MTATFRMLHKLRPDLRRWCGFALAILVLALAVLAVSPAAHHWLHADADHANHECAVTLFAQGVTSALVVAVLAAVVMRVHRLEVEADELLLEPPRYLHAFGRGPPRY